MPKLLSPAGVRRRPRRIRKRTVLLALVSLVAAGGLGGYLYLSTTASRMLRAARADADRLDPGWSQAEIEAKRERIADAENSAFQVRRVMALLPADWPPQVRVISAAFPSGYEYDDIVTRMTGTPPDVRLTETLAAEARHDLATYAGAVTEARKLAEMPRGRAPIVYDPNPMMTLLPHIQATRPVARLLAADAYLRAHDGDADGALDSCRAILGAARAIGDEPFLISQLVRIAIDGMAIDAIQRVLAQGEPSEAALARVQARLAEEMEHSPLLTGLRGERGGIDDLMRKLTAGELDMTGVAGTMGRSFPRLPLSASFYEYNHALLLDQMNRAVEIARRPDREQVLAWRAWEDSTKPPDQLLPRMAGALSLMLGSAGTSAAMAHLRLRAQLASAGAMVAAERHRIAHGARPDSIAAIDPRFGADLPGDPFVMGPLKGRPEVGRLAIYSVGLDLKDNGGRYDPKKDWGKAGTDIGVSLFDPLLRRRPPGNELPKSVFQSRGRRGPPAPPDPTEPIP